MPSTHLLLTACFLCAMICQSLNAQCPGDLDGDGQINGADLGLFLSAWGACGEECPSDLDDNGTVGGSDLGLLLANWGICKNDDGDGPFNYGQALQKAITFYDAQRAGTYQGRLEWRSDAFTTELQQENGSYLFDPGILNRYMDAGDTPTFVLPITSSMTILAWSGIDFAKGWEQTNQRDELESALRFHADWCMAAHPEPDVFCGQIGQGGPSHGFWGPPEIHEVATGYAPKIWWLNESNPGSEPAGEAAAFLSAMSMLMSTSDPDYSARCLEHARDLYSFANEHRGTYVDSIPDAIPFYNSWSGYHDELVWAAAWLHRATGEATYLIDAESHFLATSPDPGWTHSWDGKINGATLLLAYLTNDPVYLSRIQENLDNWLPGGSVQYTPGGLAWLDTWGSLRYSANASFLAFAHAELIGDPDGRYRNFGESQLNYILGDNPRNSSYVCGFGNQSPLSPHHRGAHGSWNNNIDDPAPNRHVLWGALVGGPDHSDQYIDDRSDYIANEVACDYNAGFTAAMARMAREYGGDPLPDSVFPPAENSYGLEMFVEAAILEDEPSFTRVRCILNNRSAWPARWSDQLSYRIYLDLSETINAGFGPDDIEVESGFLDGGVIGEIEIANPSSHLYFVEISYEGVEFGPGQGSDSFRESQVRFGLRSGVPSEAWDASNDPSFLSLPFGQSSVVKSPSIPVYEGNMLIYGEEGVSDCNNNGIDDSEEIENGAQDLDDNGQPDECDPDCNEDGIPDAREIMDGAADCDQDGVPDGCRTSEDCDSDGIDDACAVNDGTTPDCNANGIPDQCDIADGEADLDEDGVPDSCQLNGVSHDFAVTDQWDGGFTARLVVSNNSKSPIIGWIIEWDASYEVASAWGCLLINQIDGVVEVANLEWNETIPAGGLIEIGFQGIGLPNPPSVVRVNGSETDG